MTAVVSLYSPKGTYDSSFLSNYANITVEPVLSRVDGVGNTTVFGLMQYAMRVWLDPNKLSQLGLSTNDVLTAVKSQNNQASLGSVGGEPSIHTHPLTPLHAHPQCIPTHVHAHPPIRTSAPLHLQISAPHYVLLVSNVGGEQRFASSVARRLEMLGTV